MDQRLVHLSYLKILGRVDHSSSEGLRPATRSRDPEFLLNTQHDCTNTDGAGSRKQVAGRRGLNCQHALGSRHKKSIRTKVR